MRNSVFKIYYSRRIDRNAKIAGFEMEMGTGAAACVTTESNRLSGLDILVRLNEEAA